MSPKADAIILAPRPCLTELGDHHLEPLSQPGRQSVEPSDQRLVFRLALVSLAVDVADNLRDGYVVAERLAQCVRYLADGRAGTRRIDSGSENIADPRTRDGFELFERGRDLGRVALPSNALDALDLRFAHRRVVDGAALDRILLLKPVFVDADDDSSPLTMATCLRVATSSIRRFGRPDSTALVIPPSASTSSISSHASLASSLVRLST
jgi:hypothetical protein